MYMYLIHYMYFAILIPYQEKPVCIFELNCDKIVYYFESCQH